MYISKKKPRLTPTSNYNHFSPFTCFWTKGIPVPKNQQNNKHGTNHKKQALCNKNSDKQKVYLQLAASRAGGERERQRMVGWVGGWGIRDIRER